MSTRIVMVDYINFAGHEDGDQCTGCKRHDRKQCTCKHFGKLARKPDTKATYMRHPNCIRAEERTRHASHSQIMMRDDFAPEHSAIFDKDNDTNDDD